MKWQIWQAFIPGYYLLWCFWFIWIIWIIWIS